MRDIESLVDDSIVSTETIDKMLDAYRNIKDSDIEDFLRNKARDYQKRGWCSVYFLLDEEKKNKGEFFINGYFTLSIKSLIMGDSISKTLKKKLFRGVYKEENSIPCILIGQIGKYCSGETDKTNQYTSSMNEILDNAFEIIGQVVERIPCSFSLVECLESNNKVFDKYTDYGFKLLQVHNSFAQLFYLI
ncbi:MAG: hypothetical protein J5929_08485 [Eubacterium sp.]|nr:hypothetical protein [Eubacterium sp.]